ncbi:MAG: S9 family peptidase [Candidatus Eisenbacteria bacterium]|nr:S9 family peptidase [Candidatus Eisenbacteria bacterium]
MHPSTWLHALLPLILAKSSMTTTQSIPIESRPRPELQRYTIEQLFAARTNGGADWSPDGARVVFATNISGRANLWLVPAAGGWPQQLTVSDQRQASPAWSPDGRWIAFQSDHDANEQWDLFLVSPANGRVINLTNTPKIAEEGPVWSRDSRWIAFARKPEAAPNFEVHLWDVDRGVERALTRDTPSDQSLSPVAFVPGGKWLLASRSHASGKDGDVVLVDLATGVLRNLTAHAGEQRWDPTDVSPDGSKILLTSDAKNGFENVALLDVNLALAASGAAGTTGAGGAMGAGGTAGGGAATGAPAGPPAAAITWVTNESWEMQAGSFSPDGHWLTYHANVDGNGEVYLFNPFSGRRDQLVLGGGYNTLAGGSGSFSKDGTRLLLLRNAAGAPGELVVYEVDRATSRQITQSFVGGVDPSDMVEPALIHYESSDRQKISAFLYLPWNLRRDGSNPAVVWVHGGPTSQSVNSFNRTVQYLVNHGYVVLAPNYRGSTGYGKAFMDANRFDMGGGDLADVVAGAKFLGTTGYVNAKRIAIGGGSYGGYMTMIALTKSPETWAAGVAMFPFVNWFTEVEREDPLLREYDLATMGDPKASEALYRDRSPVFFLDRIAAPLLLVAGANDPRCPASESQQVSDAMKQSGKPCDFLLYADEGHGFAKRENLFDAYAKVVAFLDRTLKTK